MSRQNVGTPRFYVDYLQWAFAIGLVGAEDVILDDDLDIESPEDLFRLNPTKQTIISPTSGWDSDEKYIRIPTGLSTLEQANFNYSFILGHNFKEANVVFLSTTSNENSSDNYNAADEINFVGSNYNGWSGYTFTEQDASPQEYYSHILLTLIRLEGGSDLPIKIGAFSFGRYYDMTNAPNLSLTLTREYGYDKMTAYDGTTLTNANWTRPADWGDLPAWGLADAEDPIDSNLSRTGRRNWSLSFNYLDSSDLMAINEMINTNELTDTNELTTLLDDTSFYSQVIHKTLGGELPFLFQPDNTNFNPDAFALAKFDMDSFKMKRVAPQVYNISLKIMEVW